MFQTAPGKQDIPFIVAHALSNHTAEKMSVAMASDLAVTAVAATQHNSELALSGATLAAARRNKRRAASVSNWPPVPAVIPNAAVSLWQKMERVSDGGRIDLLSAHPAPEKHMETLAGLVPQMMPYYLQTGERPSYKLKDAGL